ncbi:uncharacterized protein LOC124945717 [Impatiens glandulifera]|uniref:uncharacterized protein LOC124945717 n=1 Tax=Impatiens glandulifera TaxID=253017 RepID=UPI001FB178C0|nr:uncharacterized protein LOC124945717 [Impatiens glandulifera]
MPADNPTLIHETHDFWIPKTSQFYINHRHHYSNDDLQFCSETAAEDPPGSPTLWSPIRENTQSLSPNSRTQAIVKGQRELMEMIKNLPESSYELSLKDLVQDLPGLSETRKEDDDRRLTGVRNQEKVVVKRQESKKLLRTVSLDNNGSNGMLLKMVFPVSFRGTSRSRRKKTTTAPSTAMVPRPDCLDKSSKGERDNWWKTRSSSSSTSHGSRSSGSGSDSNNSSRNNNERKMSSFLPYCCSSSFILAMATQRERK